MVVAVKPTIAILPLIDVQRESWWMVPGYMEGILAAGGLPVMLPLTSDDADIKRITAMYDGFLFPGGQDVSPGLYGASVSPCCGETVPELDAMSRALFAAVTAKEKPILGICRGHQLINALLGGDLYQDLPTDHPSNISHAMTPPYDRAVHDVNIDSESPLYRLLKASKIGVNSYHHQAVKTLAKDLKPMATAPDGIIEAAYMPALPFVWTVQWHPEFSYQTDPDSQRIFRAVVASCE